MPTDQALKKALVDYLDHPGTHASFIEATRDFPAGLINKKLAMVPYTPWMLLEHIRVTQHDMVDFMANPNYRSLEWPKDYWPDVKQKADKKMWDASVAGYKKDAESLRTILRGSKTDPLSRIPWGEGQTVLREVMQIIDHGSYHIGELILMRRMMGNWKRS